jgi:hypothetical protein
MTRLACITFFLIAGTVVHAHPGVGIVEDSRGNVFYTDLKQVWRIAPDGAKTVAVPNVHTHELYVDAEDNLFGEHLWYEGDATKRWGHRVWRLARDGTLTDVIPAREGFLSDYSFVRDKAGNMYWADRGTAGERAVIKRRSPNGMIMSHASGDFRDIRWMTAAADGTLFFIDQGDLRRVSPQGKVSTLVSRLSSHDRPPQSVANRHYHQGLWTDRDGNVYVAVTEERLVLKIGKEAKKTVVARTVQPETSAGAARAGLPRLLAGIATESWSPTSGMVDRSGSLWLLEYSSRHQVRVRRITQDGKERVY